MTDSNPLVLLPGHMCDLRLFEPQIEALQSEREIRFFPLTEGASMQAYASQVLSAVDNDFALAGLSMGGIAAMEIMRQAPQRVERLALMDTNPLAEPAEVAEMRNGLIERVSEGGLEAVMREELKPRYLAESEYKDAILDLCMDMAVNLGPAVFKRQALAIRDRRDQQETLGKIFVPTLVLCGAEDTLCPLERHQLMAELIPGARLEVIEAAGHLPTLEQADQVNRVLRDWLSW